MTKSSTDIKLEWNLPIIMAHRGIRTATELQRMLRDVGVEITSHQLSRLVKSAPRRVSSNVMYGLTQVLQCPTSDLWRNPAHTASVIFSGEGGVRPVATPGERSTPRSAPKKSGTKSSDLVVGPKASPYPIRHRDKR